MSRSNDWNKALTDFHGEYEVQERRPRICDGNSFGTTIMHCSRSSPDGRPWLIYSPVAADSPRDEILLRYGEFAADPNTPPDVIGALHVLHPWCEKIRKSIAMKRLRASCLPKDLSEDVTQTVGLAIWRIATNCPKVHDWFMEAGGGFHGWTYKLNDNLGGAVVRALRRESLGNKSCHFFSNADHDWWKARDVADEGVASIADIDWELDLPKRLVAFPERTRQVLEKLCQGLSLTAIAQELGISRDAVRWAIDGWIEAIREAFVEV